MHLYCTFILCFHAARFPGLTVGASAEALSGAGKGRLFERSEFEPRLCMAVSE